jgi:hypothetical protein
MVQIAELRSRQSDSKEQLGRVTRSEDALKQCAIWNYNRDEKECTEIRHLEEGLKVCLQNYLTRAS